MPPMRRWLPILLLMLLPLQAVWAAAAPYCEHEESPTAMHVGHHTHEHQGSQADDQEPSSTSFADHADCPACHGAAAAVPALTGSAAVAGDSDAAPTWLQSIPRPPVFPPDRPNWSRLA